MASIDRRRFLGACAVAPVVFGWPDRTAVAWHDVAEWGVEGQGWSNVVSRYDRLPRKAQKIVRGAVWNLSRHSAGMCVGFETDAPAIHVRYELTQGRLAMPHMPATGVSGVDLYGLGTEGTWRWVNVTRPAKQKVEARLANGLAPGKREYRMYLPLYNGVTSLAVGVPEGHGFRRVAPRQKKPLVYYGTSIAHGACASRPGIAFPSILGRRLDIPLINLGFSGNGRMEPELSALIGEIDAAVYVLDCLPNMGAARMVSERAAPFVRALRKKHPKTPIVMVEDRTFTNADFFPGRRKGHSARRAAYRKAYDALRKEGVKGLSYVEGENLLGTDGEGATDGSHPNDLGMMRYADALEAPLRAALASRR